MNLLKFNVINGYKKIKDIRINFDESNTMIRISGEYRSFNQYNTEMKAEKIAMPYKKRGEVELFSNG
jgi:hypothetical protein